MIQTQRLQAADWQRLRSIRLAALADAPDAFGATLTDAEQRSDADWQRQIETLATFIATDGLIDCGMVRGGHDEDIAGDAWLLSMWVAPEHRAQRVGQLLVEQVVQWARQEGFTRLLLDVADANQAAINLYQSCGFSPTGNTSHLAPPRQHITEHERVLVL